MQRRPNADGRPSRAASSPGQAGELLDIVVPAEQAETRIDQVLTALVPELSRSQAQRLIRAGRVQVDGTTVKASAIAHGGARVAVDMPPAASPVPGAEALPLDIVHEDEDIVVVDKPAGLVVHPAAGHTRGTLVNALLHHVQDLSGVGGEQRPGIVHRLDRGTSGLMVVAKHDQAHRELGRQFEDREIEKEYAALVWGRVEAGRRIDLPIGRDQAVRKRMSTRARRARTAVTRIVRAEPLAGLTLLRVIIATGRTHQIRVHLSAIGHPVVGDAVYGGIRRRLAPKHRAVARLTRPFLHAERLAFAHPRDGRRIEFRAPLPDDLERVLHALRDVS